MRSPFAPGHNVASRRNPRPPRAAHFIPTERPRPRRKRASHGPDPRIEPQSASSLVKEPRWHVAKPSRRAREGESYLLPNILPVARQFRRPAVTRGPAGASKVFFFPQPADANRLPANAGHAGFRRALAPMCGAFAWRGRRSAGARPPRRRSSSTSRRNESGPTAAPTFAARPPPPAPLAPAQDEPPAKRDRVPPRLHFN